MFLQCFKTCKTVHANFDRRTTQNSPGIITSTQANAETKRNIPPHMRGYNFSAVLSHTAFFSTTQKKKKKKKKNGGGGGEGKKKKKKKKKKKTRRYMHDQAKRGTQRLIRQANAETVCRVHELFGRSGE